MSVAFPQQRLVEHLLTLEVDVGEQAVVRVCPLLVELEFDLLTLKLGGGELGSFIGVGLFSALRVS